MNSREEEKEKPRYTPGEKSRVRDSFVEEPEMHKVLPESLTASFRSKKDLYDWFTLHLQLVLPPYKECRVSKPPTPNHL